MSVEACFWGILSSCMEVKGMCKDDVSLFMNPGSVWGGSGGRPLAPRPLRGQHMTEPQNARSHAHLPEEVRHHHVWKGLGPSGDLGGQKQAGLDRRHLLQHQNWQRVLCQSPEERFQAQLRADLEKSQGHFAQSGFAKNDVIQVETGLSLEGFLHQLP